MNNNVLESNTDKREESINLDLNASTYSEINMKNMSFYSYNDQATDLRYNNEYVKSKSEKRMEIDSYKMLPYYIEKVSKNIQYLDELIKKQNINPDSSAFLNNIEAIPNIENLNSLIKKSVSNVNEVLANNKLALEGSDKNKLNIQGKTTNLSMDAKTLLKISKTGNKFDVIDEKDEDMITKKDTSLNQKGLSLKNARIVKKSFSSLQGGTPSVKRFSATASSKGVMNNKASSHNNSYYNTNNSLQSKYKTTNTSAIGNSSASRPKTAAVIKKPGLSGRPDGRNSTKDLKNYMSYNTVTSKDSNQLKKNLNSSRLDAQIKSANIGAKNKQTILHNQRQSSLANIRNAKNTAKLEKVIPRRVFSPSPYQTAPSKKLMANLTIQKKGIPGQKMAAVKNNLNQSVNSNNQSINIGNKLIGKSSKCTCVCTCNGDAKNISASNMNLTKLNDIQACNVYNTTTATERLLTTTIPQFNINDNQNADFKIQLKKLCEMYMISHEFSAMKNNSSTEKDSKLFNFLKSTLKSLDDEPEVNTNKNISYMNLSGNYNSNSSNSGIVPQSDRRKELNKRRDEMKATRIIQIQRKWREHMMKKTFGLNNFSLKSSVKSKIIKSTKEIFYSMFNSHEKLNEMIQLTNKANQLWNEINENSSKHIYIFNNY